MRPGPDRGRALTRHRSTQHSWEPADLLWYFRTSSRNLVYDAQKRLPLKLRAFVDLVVPLVEVA
jgi:hypothetical protein